jgi:hypothetical protein
MRERETPREDGPGVAKAQRMVDSRNRDAKRSNV